MKLEIRHLARIEGHAHLVIDAAKGELRDCRLEVVESPRFFEAMLKGRHYTDVAPIAARICGVCSNSHTLVSLAATEAAFGIAISDQTRSLRQLLTYGEVLQSHLLQLFFMAVPDYFGVASILPLAKQERALVSRALQLKKLANDLCLAVGGRPVHPVTPCVGGFLTLPEVSDLQELRRRMVDAIPDLEASVDLFAGFDFPEFERETDCLCLQDEYGYPVFGTRLVSRRGRQGEVADYQGLIEEFLVGYSTAKFARLSGESFMVGPLARLRNHFELLSPMARQVADALGITPQTANPYRILGARLVEVVHCIEQSIHLIDQLLLDGLVRETPAIVPRAGYGAGAIEAPRGTLFHAYRYDEQGRILEADCLIPTAQNLANIEADLRLRVPQLLGLERAELTRQLEMLVRAYDPCISCSTHLLKVDFV